MKPSKILKITHTVPLSLFIIIASVTYSMLLFFKGYRISRFTASQVDLLNEFLKLNDEEIKKELLIGSTIKLSRGKGHFTDGKMDGIVFTRIKDKIIIGFGMKEDKAFIVSKNMQYYDKITNDYKEFVDNVKNNGFGKILYKDNTAHLYYDCENHVKRIQCDSFKSKCMSLQLIT